ncbi:MAG: phosphoribosylanthranilate isomerase, partial [Lentisphaerae bacterium]|nr:phosphoribosylanthranilate isomerase [Lentisphaerota bacterium]
MDILQIKICGLTNRDDVLCALDNGADYLGFVTYPRSPRAIGGLEIARLLDGIDRSY